MSSKANKKAALLKAAQLKQYNIPGEISSNKLSIISITNSALKVNNIEDIEKFLKISNCGDINIYQSPNDSTIYIVKKEGNNFLVDKYVLNNVIQKKNNKEILRDKLENIFVSYNIFISNYLNYFMDTITNDVIKEKIKSDLDEYIVEISTSNEEYDTLLKKNNLSNDILNNFIKIILDDIKGLVEYSLMLAKGIKKDYKTNKINEISTSMNKNITDFSKDLNKIMSNTQSEKKSSEISQSKNNKKNLMEQVLVNENEYIQKIMNFSRDPALYSKNQEYKKLIDNLINFTREEFNKFRGKIRDNKYNINNFNKDLKEFIHLFRVNLYGIDDKPGKYKNIGNYLNKH